jgi:hypothetical protein
MLPPIKEDVFKMDHTTKLKVVKLARKIDDVWHVMTDSLKANYKEWWKKMSAQHGVVFRELWRVYTNRATIERMEK